MTSEQELINPYSRQELINPYLGSIYKKTDFDMRRKIEILKYNGNASDTKTNNLTKKQIWSLISKGGYNKLTDAQKKNAKAIGNNISVLNDCAVSNTIRTPTSSCNVPGPIIELYNDTNVPLYNYVSSVGFESVTHNTKPYRPTCLIQTIQ